MGAIIDIDGMTENIDAAMKRAAVRVARDLQEAYNLSINDFYDSYPQPRKYRRTYSTYKASTGNDGKGHFKKALDLVRRAGDMTYSARIDVNGANIPGNAYDKKKPTGQKLSVEEVFRRVWYSGIHGFTQGELHAPWDKIFYPAPPKTTPAIQYMNERFADIADISNLNEIIMSELHL